jgi:predicted amidohydrolase YtcJ
MTVAEDDIHNTRSLLTMVGGKIVYADQPFREPSRSRK